MSHTNNCRCGAPIPAMVFACDKCTRAGIVDLSDSADYLAHLDDKRAKRSSNFRMGSGGKSAETPLPYDSRVHDIASSARTALTGWVRLTMTEHGCRDLPSGRDTARIARLDSELNAWRKVYKEANNLAPADAATIRTIVINLLADRDQAKMQADLDDLAGLCEWLAEHMDWIATRVWAVDLLDDADRLREGLQHLFDIPPDTMALGRCEAEQGDGTVCDHILAAPIGATVHQCPRCGVTHDVVQRRLDLLKRSDGFLVTAKEGARLLRLGGFNVDAPKMYAIIRVVGVRSKWRTKAVSNGRTVDHYDLGALRDAVQLTESNPDTRKAVDRARHGGRGRGELFDATLSA